MPGHSLTPATYASRAVLSADHAAGVQRLLFARDFGLVWLGQLVSQVGDGVSKLALLWFVYSITGSPIKTTVIGLLQTIPPIILGPVIGVLVDRWSKKLLLVSSDIARALLIGVIPCLISAESFTIEMLYLLVLLHAIATAIFGPALIAVVPMIVAKRQFTAANALLQGTTSLGIVMGPALSGIGIALSSSQEVLCINAVTYLLSAACLLPVRLTHSSTVTVERSSAAPLLRDLMEGVQFLLRRQPALLWLIATAALYTFGTSALTTLFPVFGRKLLDLGPVEVGYLWSALGIGLLAMSIVLVRFTEWDLPRRTALIAATSAVSGTAICGLAWIRNPLAAAVLMAVIGCGMGALTPIAWGAVQELSPREIVGRVLALYGTAAMVAAIAGISAFGWISEKLGESTSVNGIGLALLVTALFASRFRRLLTRLLMNGT
ncbi:MAG TPA: MFS transporter [Nitrospiraceae bacterium]|jgi:MFS family permease|nr:MFS transporter [Nitrospiraceae bacterium]